MRVSLARLVLPAPSHPAVLPLLLRTAPVPFSPTLGAFFLGSVPLSSPSSCSSVPASARCRLHPRGVEPPPCLVSAASPLECVVFDRSLVRRANWPRGLPILLARSWVRSPVRSVNLWAEIPNSLTKRTSSSQCGSPGGLGESPGLAGVLRGSLYPRPEATSTF